MEYKIRKKWESGMDLTPQDLIDSDDFHIEQQNISRFLQVMPCYGLLPESAYNKEGESKLFINKEGELIDFVTVKRNEYEGEIPPCIAINSHEKLKDSFEKIMKKIGNIVEQIKKQQPKYNSILLPILLLDLELKNYSMFETPKDLFLIIQKFVLIFKLNIDETLEKTQTLLDTKYRQNKIEEMINLLLESLCEIEEFKTGQKIVHIYK